MSEKIIMTPDDVRRSLARITHEIIERNRTAEHLILVGMRTRGVPLAKRLAANMEDLEGLKIPVSALDITLYRDDWTRISQQPIVQATDISFPVEGRRIILVDDVLYTGRTTRAALDALVDFGRPDRIELAVLVDRGHRELPIQANYVGKTIRTGRSEMVNVLLSEHDETDGVELANTAAGGA